MLLLTILEVLFHLGHVFAHDPDHEHTQSRRIRRSRALPRNYQKEKEVNIIPSTLAVVGSVSTLPAFTSISSGNSGGPTVTVSFPFKSFSTTFGIGTSAATDSINLSSSFQSLSPSSPSPQTVLSKSIIASTQVSSKYLYSTGPNLSVTSLTIPSIFTPSVAWLVDLTISNFIPIPTPVPPPITLTSAPVVTVSITSGIGEFDPFARSNLAVYFGHPPNISHPQLMTLCDAPEIDIVILAFVRQFYGLNNLPNINFGAGCEVVDPDNPPSSFYCPTMAKAVAHCQAVGKKVLVSIGGSLADVSFASAQDAMDAARTMWNIFGPGTETPQYRAFGNYTVDGFDIGKRLRTLMNPSLIKTVDLEVGSTDYYDNLAETFNSFYAVEEKDYYLAAAPSCANTTIVFPSGFFNYTHFVWPRFYNTLKCNVASKYFQKSVQAWYTQVSNVNGPGGGLFPRFYVGALAFNNSKTGYVAPADFVNTIEYLSNNTGPKFGGVFLWDGNAGLANIDSTNRSFLNITKSALVNEAPPGDYRDAFLLQVWRITRQGLTNVL